MDEEKLTMADFEDEINASFVKFRPGQAIKEIGRASCRERV